MVSIFELHAKIEQEWRSIENEFHSNSDRYGSVIKQECFYTLFFNFFFHSCLATQYPFPLKVYRTVEYYTSSFNDRCAIYRKQTFLFTWLTMFRETLSSRKSIDTKLKSVHNIIWHKSNNESQLRNIFLFQKERKDHRKVERKKFIFWSTFESNSMTSTRSAIFTIRKKKIIQKNKFYALFRWCKCRKPLWNFSHVNRLFKNLNVRVRFKS